MSNSHWQFMLVMVKKCHHYQKIYKKSHATLLGYNTHPQGLPRLSGYFYCSCQLDNVAHKIIIHKSRGGVSLVEQVAIKYVSWPI